MGLANKLLDVKKVITHTMGDTACPDGMASAILCNDAFGGQVPIVFMKHDSDEHMNLKPEPGYLFVDFIPYVETHEIENPEGKKVRVMTALGQAQLKAWVDAGTIVLDHHLKARDVIEAFGENGIFAHETDEPGVSGAFLAFRHVWCSLKGYNPSEDINSPALRNALDFATLAGIRDTWQKKHERWEEACEQAEVLRFYPWETWTKISGPFGRGNDDFASLFEIGPSLIERKRERVEKICESAFYFTSDKGTRVMVVNTLETSDVPAGEADIVIGYGYRGPKPRIILSTRSRGEYDVGSMCVAWGGGGHTKAAGCQLFIGNNDLNPYAFIINKVNGYESER